MAQQQRMPGAGARSFAPAMAPPPPVLQTRAPQLAPQRGPGAVAPAPAPITQPQITPRAPAAAQPPAAPRPRPAKRPAPAEPAHGPPAAKAARTQAPAQAHTQSQPSSHAQQPPPPSGQQQQQQPEPARLTVAPPDPGLHDALRAFARAHTDLKTRDMAFRARLKPLYDAQRAARQELYGHYNDERQVYALTALPPAQKQVLLTKVPRKGVQRPAPPVDAETPLYMVLTQKATQHALRDTMLDAVLAAAVRRRREHADASWREIVHGALKDACLINMPKVDYLSRCAATPLAPQENAHLYRLAVAYTDAAIQARHAQSERREATRAIREARQRWREQLRAELAQREFAKHTVDTDAAHQYTVWLAPPAPPTTPVSSLPYCYLKDLSVAVADELERCPHADEQALRAALERQFGELRVKLTVARHTAATPTLRIRMVRGRGEPEQPGADEDYETEDLEDDEDEEH